MGALFALPGGPLLRAWARPARRISYPGLDVHVDLPCLASPPRGLRGRQSPAAALVDVRGAGLRCVAGRMALGRVGVFYLLRHRYVSYLRSAFEAETRGRVAHQSVSSCGVPQSPATLSRVCHRPRRTDLDAISHRSHRNLTSRSRQDLAALDHDLLEHRRCGSLAALYTPVEAGAES